jgi:RNA polymerase sigma-70 factor, ECF subfamily
MGTTAATIGTAHLVDLKVHDKSVREFETAFSHYLPSLHRRAFRYLGNAADAEDAVRDALLSAYKHLGQFRGQAQMSTWLMAIVINSARSQMRRRPRLIRTSFDDLTSDNAGFSFLECLSDRRPRPEHAFRVAEVVEHLLQLIPQLPPALAQAFQLHDIEGLSIREMTDHLGVTEGTAKAQISRARSKLRGLMRMRHAGM